MQQKQLPRGALKSNCFKMLTMKCVFSIAAGINLFQYCSIATGRLPSKSYLDTRSTPLPFCKTFFRKIGVFILNYYSALETFLTKSIAG